MTVTRRDAFALAMGLALGTALAPADAREVPAMADDALALVRGLYAVKASEPESRFSRRLKALHDAAVAKSKEIDGPVSGTDFDFTTNSQDVEPGFRKTLRYALVSSSDTAAVVRVTFKNDTPQELVYDLVREDGKWRIDEVRSVKDEGWQLSKLYEMGAKGE